MRAVILLGRAPLIMVYREHRSRGIDGADACVAVGTASLPTWHAESEFDVQQTFSCRDAAIAAERTDQWSEAAGWLVMARDRGDWRSNPVYDAALLIDEGYARWMAGDGPTALMRLNEGLQAIDRLPPDDESEQAYLLRKRACLTIMWMGGTAGGASLSGFSAPPPACCSSLNPYSGPKIPSTPSDIIWAQLLDFEHAARLGDGLLRAHTARLAKSPYGLVRVQIGMLRLRDCLRALAIADLVQLIGELAEALELDRQFYKEGGHGDVDPLPVDIPLPNRASLPRRNVLAAMTSGVFAVAARGEITDQVIDAWRAGAAEAQLSATLDPWLDSMRRLFVTHESDPLSVLRDASQDDWLLASVCAAIDQSSRPAELLRVHAGWAMHLPALQQSCFPVDDVERLVTEGWRRLSTTGAFLLRSPGTTVPELERAFASKSTGWRKIGEVLIAAADATPGATPEYLLRAIRELVTG
jgi:hypothetical protein